MEEFNTFRKYLMEGEIGEENIPSFLNKKKKELNQVLEDNTLVDLLKFFGEYYTNTPPIKRLFTSSYKQLEKIKEELPRYQAIR
jgi:hypothetical protein